MWWPVVDLQLIRPSPGFRCMTSGLPDLATPGWARALGGPDGCWLSEDERYRTLLWRSWSEAPPLAFGMMNPSVANHLKPDPTVTRCLGYARREKAGGLIVVNRSPWRDTRQGDLEAAFLAGRDVLLTERNVEAWAVAARLASKLVLAWGTPKGTWPRAARGAHDAALLKPFAGRVFTIGPVAMSGEPKHPLYLRGLTEMSMDEKQLRWERAELEAENRELLGRLDKEGVVHRRLQDAAAALIGLQPEGVLPERWAEVLNGGTAKDVAVLLEEVVGRVREHRAQVNERMKKIAREGLLSDAQRAGVVGALKVGTEAIRDLRAKATQVGIPESAFSEEEMAKVREHAGLPELPLALRSDAPETPAEAARGPMDTLDQQLGAEVVNVLAEKLYWKFDAAKRDGQERWHFKGAIREAMSEALALKAAARVGATSSAGQPMPRMASLGRVSAVHDAGSRGAVVVHLFEPFPSGLCTRLSGGRVKVNASNVGNPRPGDWLIRDRSTKWTEPGVLVLAPEGVMAGDHWRIQTGDWLWLEMPPSGPTT